MDGLGRACSVFAAFGMGLSVPATADAQQPVHRSGDPTGRIAEVRESALTDPTAMRLVESLTTEVGARPVGSPAMDRARDWAVANLRSLGFHNVKTETFTTRAWTRGHEEAEVLAPFPHKLRILGLGNSPSTPAGGVTGRIILFSSLDDLLAQPEGSLRGAIVVVTQKMRRTQDASGYFAGNAVRARGPSEAAKRGAVAFLLRSVSTGSARLPHTGGSRGGIPAAALAPADADLLERLVKRGPVTLRLTLESTLNEKALAYNVSGEISGTTHPDEIVLIGGHLDSWDVGMGAIDNATGVAITIAAAKLATRFGRPQRTIRVVLWGAEEQGGAGRAYFEAHRSELEKIVVAGESDSGGGSIVKVALPYQSASHAEFAPLRRAWAPLGVLTSADPASYAHADIAPLAQAGVPFVDFQQDLLEYFDHHHSDDDTLDKIEPADIAQNAAVWASFLYVVANSTVEFRNMKPANPAGKSK